MRDDTIARVRALSLAGTVVLACAFSASPPSITFTNIAGDAGLDNDRVRRARSKHVPHRDDRHWRGDVRL